MADPKKGSLEWEAEPPAQAGMKLLGPSSPSTPSSLSAFLLETEVSHLLLTKVAKYFLKHVRWVPGGHQSLVIGYPGPTLAGHKKTQQLQGFPTSWVSNLNADFMPNSGYSKSPEVTT